MPVDLEETVDIFQLKDSKSSWGRALPESAIALLDAEAPELPGFAVLEKVGAGGFGAVYRARDLLLDREVAIKVLLPHVAEQSGAHDRLLREARALARIRHPNVVAIYGVLRDGERLAMVTEFVRGRALDGVLEEQGPFDAGDACDVGVQTARALSAVHAAGLIHRDLKAANLIREPGGRVVLADFGLGMSLRGDVSREELGRRSGSPLFMAPEQVRGEAPDPRTDIYGLGVVLYNLLSGAFPVHRERLQELLSAIEHGDWFPLSLLRPELPRGLLRIVHRALSRDPAERFQSAEAMAEALETALVQIRAGRGGNDAAA
jgi:serine/threonine protein kinase